MKLTIREAQANDAPAILAVLNPIIESGTVAFDAPLSEEDERTYLAAAYSYDTGVKTADNLALAYGGAIASTYSYSADGRLSQATFARWGSRARTRARTARPSP